MENDYTKNAERCKNCGRNLSISQHTRIVMNVDAPRICSVCENKDPRGSAEERYR